MKDKELAKKAIKEPRQVAKHTDSVVEAIHDSAQEGSITLTIRGRLGSLKSSTTSQCNIVKLEI